MSRCICEGFECFILVWIVLESELESVCHLDRRHESVDNG